MAVVQLITAGFAIILALNSFAVCTDSSQKTAENQTLALKNDNNNNAKNETDKVKIDDIKSAAVSLPSADHAPGFAFSQAELLATSDLKIQPLEPADVSKPRELAATKDVNSTTTTLARGTTTNRTDPPLSVSFSPIGVNLPALLAVNNNNNNSEALTSLPSAVSANATADSPKPFLNISVSVLPPTKEGTNDTTLLHETSAANITQPQVALTIVRENPFNSTIAATNNQTMSDREEEKSGAKHGSGKL